MGGNSLPRSFDPVGLRESVRRFEVLGLKHVTVTDVPNFGVSLLTLSVHQRIPV